MSTLILTILIIISALLHLWAEYNGPPIQIYIFKPLTTSLIIILAALAKPPVNRRYNTALIIGLIFSLGGDVLLMLPFDLFVLGLVSFLIAHLVYIYAFKGARPWRLNWMSALVCLAYGVGIFLVLAPGLGDMTIPVIAYILVIIIMAYTAWEQWQQTHSRWALLAFIGALLFVLADTILAINKFRFPFLAGRALNLSTYFAAQWLISRSISKTEK
ncbi:MAG: lysoplasmalogenase [Anaerolineales bacterium]|nr:lysoplasmalogenase [Anaerolineales bacterium]